MGIEGPRDHSSREGEEVAYASNEQRSLAATYRKKAANMNGGTDSKIAGTKAYFEGEASSHDNIAEKQELAAELKYKAEFLSNINSINTHLTQDQIKKIIEVLDEAFSPVR